MWYSYSVSVFYSRWCSEIYHTITFNGIEFIWISWGLHSPSLCNRDANDPDYIWFEGVLKEGGAFILEICVFSVKAENVYVLHFSGFIHPLRKSYLMNIQWKNWGHSTVFCKFQIVNCLVQVSLDFFSLSQWIYRVR